MAMPEKQGLPLLWKIQAARGVSVLAQRARDWHQAIAQQCVLGIAARRAQAGGPRPSRQRLPLTHERKRAAGGGGDGGASVADAGVAIDGGQEISGADAPLNRVFPFTVGRARRPAEMTQLVVDVVADGLRWFGAGSPRAVTLVP